jgi:hypothetical protein
MSTIFGFSAAEGDESQSLSDKITVRVIEIINPDYETLDEVQQKEYFDKVSFAVRKTGHFGEYAILALLWSALFITFPSVYSKRHGKFIILISVTLLCMIYAITDEYHQGFVEGRSPKAFDVGIDTAGAFCGSMFLMIICMFADKKKKRKEVCS